MFAKRLPLGFVVMVSLACSCASQNSEPGGSGSGGNVGTTGVSTAPGGTGTGTAGSGGTSTGQRGRRRNGCRRRIPGQAARPVAEGDRGWHRLEAWRGWSDWHWRRKRWCHHGRGSGRSGTGCTIPAMPACSALVTNAKLPDPFMSMSGTALHCHQGRLDLPASGNRRAAAELGARDQARQAEPGERERHHDRRECNRRRWNEVHLVHRFDLAARRQRSLPGHHRLHRWLVEFDCRQEPGRRHHQLQQRRHCRAEQRELARAGQVLHPLRQHA